MDAGIGNESRKVEELYDENIKKERRVPNRNSNLITND
jgi:hypothetical protein